VNYHNADTKVTELVSGKQGCCLSFLLGSR